MTFKLDELHTPPEAPAPAERVASGELEATEDYNTYPPASVPTVVADRIISDVFTTGGHRCLVHWDNAWWSYTGTHYQRVEPRSVRKAIQARLKQVTVKDGNGAHKPWNPTTHKINEVMDAIATEVFLAEGAEPPLWLSDVNEHGRVEAKNLPRARPLSMSNGLFNPQTGQFGQHTANYFTTWALSFPYDPQARCPEWEKFTTEVFEHDPKAALLLQEFMGYLISGRTDLHKALMVVGVPRAGKGTIQRVMTALMGASNVAAPTLTSLGGQFGASALIGKPLAILADARGSDTRHGLSTAVERLLNITGNDSMGIDRKHQTEWIGTLPTRVVLMSNEIPRFSDSSQSIANRFVGFQLVTSFEGKEDRDLDGKLKAELPGIFLWSLAGLQRLNKQGRFTIPTTQAELVEGVKESAAPVPVFLSEEYEITGDKADWVPHTEVFARYRLWCESNGHRPTTSVELGRRINAANIPGVAYKNTTPPTGGKRIRLVWGVKLRDL
ncbi:NTP-binding protein [Corynebacterium sp. 366]|uniref:DNA primase family protein n=1 Tax=Corynebacterium sp. 366 TaxID=2652251 RepID=UPI00125CB9A5|nr:phage/plasmid primase, P4 family [Corynebacterium sp. 366]KAB3538728.1 NTP-binding protein [Corynebacterium sp. 366]